MSANGTNERLGCEPARSRASSLAQRKLRAYDRSGPGGALDCELSAEGFDAVGESSDP
jgi:hypothetical protein